MRRSIPTAIALLGLTSVVAAANSTRYVFAHVVQGDFQQYSQQDYADDFVLAQQADIDAFAINVGCDTTDAAQLAKMFAAAEAGSFQLFFSFDMGYFNTTTCASQIVPTYMPYVNSSAYFNYNGQALVSTFAGDTAGTFVNQTTDLTSSNANWAALWTQVQSTYGKTVYFVPNFSDATNIASDSFQGVMAWQNAWGPAGRSTNLTLDAAGDTAYTSDAAASGLSFLAPVSAFFFVGDAPDNNYIYRSDDWLLPNIYSQLIESSSPPPFIELLSWNDFGESHYLGPLRADANAPMNATGYATAEFDHQPMLWLSAYYSQWYKSGNKPSISTESVVWWYRPHSKNAVATAPTQAQPTNYQVTDDTIWAAVLLPKSSKAKSLIISSNGVNTTVALTAGQVNLVSAPFTAGAQAINLVDSKGVSILNQTGAEIEASPTIYNFNYHSYISPTNAIPSLMFSNATGSSSGSSGSTSGAEMLSPNSPLKLAFVVAASMAVLVVGGSW